MSIRRLLIFFPLGITVILLQAFFWVPTYDKQHVGNPDRLLRYITGSTGDAEILNPILSADSASSEINKKVFDGLIDLDDQLNFRPRLAESWKQYEEAYLTLNLQYPVQGQVLPTARSWAKYIRKALAINKSWIQNIEKIQILPQKIISDSVELDVRGENGSGEKVQVDFRVFRPARLKFVLKRIDQDFFKPVVNLLGKEYFLRFPYLKFIRAREPSQQKLLNSHLTDLLKVKEHNPVIIFKLRQGVKFHDGHEFDADDVLFTYRALMNPKNASPRTSDYEPVKTAEVLNRFKIRFTYKRLFSPAINAWTMGILPEHLLNAEQIKLEAENSGLPEDKMKNFSVRDSRFNQHPVGTGPFKFKEWKADQLIRLTRNPDYWDVPPEYKEYVVRIIPDGLTQEMEFYAGAIEQYGVQPHQVERFEKEEKFQRFSTIGFSFSYIGYNLRKPFFRSSKVRAALGMAVDVEQIIEHVLYREGERITGPYAKETDWYDSSVKPIPYDPEGALRILDELGWKKNSQGWLEKDGKVFEFNLITNNGNPVRKNIMTIVQDSWRKIGIKCNTQLFEWAVFLKDFVNSGKFDALVLGWSMGVDPDLYQIWHSSQVGPRQLNFIGYKNSEVDRLILRIRKEYDKRKQIAMTHNLHRLIAKDQPYTFLFVRKATRVLDKKIVIVERQADGTESYKKIFPMKGGRLEYYFNKWRKLPAVPEVFQG